MLPKELNDKWAEAAKTGEPVEIGDIVVCDSCDKDYTNLPDSGGIIFGSYAYCPKCTIQKMPTIRGYGEIRYIKAECPEGQSFADFVRQYRGPHSTISITNVPK